MVSDFLFVFFLGGGAGEVVLFCFDRKNSTYPGIYYCAPAWKGAKNPSRKSFQCEFPEPKSSTPRGIT